MAEVHMLIKVSTARVRGCENDQFIGRLALAAMQGRVNDPKLVDAMLKRGVCRQIPRRQSLSERDGDWQE